MLRSGTTWRLTLTVSATCGPGIASGPSGRGVSAERDRSSRVRLVPRIRIEASAGEICAAGMRIRSI